jgi:Asp-tRNA(Asn)/Glu-tRNA(Gln) amidotransferase A subunit family amidase
LCANVAMSRRSDQPSQAKPAHCGQLYEHGSWPYVMQRVFDGGVDVLLTPTATATAPTFAEWSRLTPLEKNANDVFTVPASLAGMFMGRTWVAVGAGPAAAAGCQWMTKSLLRAAGHVDSCGPRGIGAPDWTAGTCDTHRPPILPCIAIAINAMAR